jgi:hypothetical protein
MKKYKRKPVLVEAIQFSSENQQEVLKLLKVSGAYVDESNTTDGMLVIPTDNGRIIANYGDYLVKAENNRFYRVKADSFDKDWEETNEVLDGNEGK